MSGEKFGEWLNRKEKKERERRFRGKKKERLGGGG